MKNILVHTCCAPCATWCFEKLNQDGYSPVSFFYNPNIMPEDEHDRRLKELIKYLNTKDFNLIVEEDSSQVWQKAVKGYENDTEGGKRCELCFKLRLEKTAQYAKANKFGAFTTTLTVSPHKNAEIINQIGKEIGEKHEIHFLEENFKKKDGYKKSLQLSKESDLYRQNYCGCIPT